MRIVHITPDYHPALGGGELYVKEVSERLASRGHDVTVLALNSRGLSGPAAELLPRHEVINRVQVRRLNHTFRLHQALMGVRGAQRVLGLAVGAERLKMLSISPWSPRALLLTLGAGADVVGVFNWYHGALAYQTSIARRFSDFAYVGIPLFHTERPWAGSPLFARILARCDAVATMTEHEKRFVESRSRRPMVRIIGAGVDPARFVNADGRRLRAAHGIDGVPVVGYVGRMAATKGVATLIEALKLVWRTDPTVRLLLAGSGLPPAANCDDDVRAAFAALSETERSRIVAVGAFADDQKASLLDALDVFAMPSVAESFGIAYLEAWLCGKAVIGARIGSTECVIRDGVDGLLVPPGAPADLAKSIAALLSDRRGRDQMGQAGREKTLASFTWDKIADAMETLYADARARQGVGPWPRPAAA